MHTLSASNITKKFGAKTVLDAITLECSTGEILGIFGRNGSGKSTLLKILFGTQKADNIRLMIDDNAFSLKEIIPQQKIAYLPQDAFLPKNLKVRDVIPMYFADGGAQDKLFYRPAIHKIVNTKIGSLSMGELRYLELLLVGHLDHPFLMLDEPFSMIEPLHKELIKEFLSELKATKGIIVTDHYYRDVLSVSNRNILLTNGKALPIQNENQLTEHGYLPSP